MKETVKSMPPPWVNCENVDEEQKEPKTVKRFCFYCVAVFGVVEIKSQWTLPFVCSKVCTSILSLMLILLSPIPCLISPFIPPLGRVTIYVTLLLSFMLFLFAYFNPPYHSYSPLSPSPPVLRRDYHSWINRGERGQYYLSSSTPLFPISHSYFYFIYFLRMEDNRDEKKKKRDSITLELKEGRRSSIHIDTDEWVDSQKKVFLYFYLSC